MEITSIQKNIRSSPRKMRLVVDMIKNMKPAAAMQILQFTNKTAALPLSKAIKTVLGNAKSQNLDASLMVFKTIEVNEGTKMKRFRAGTKGRAKPYKKRLSHIKIILTDEIQIGKATVVPADLEKRTIKKQGGQSKAAE